MKYFIAYKDEYGKDFNGLPWIIPESGFDDITFAKRIKQDLTKRGFIDVKVFKSKYTCLSPNTGWDYVNDNEIEK